jgi:hypothetical protein
MKLRTGDKDHQTHPNLFELLLSIDLPPLLRTNTPSNTNVIFASMSDTAVNQHFRIPCIVATLPFDIQYLEPTTARSRKSWARRWNGLDE